MRLARSHLRSVSLALDAWVRLQLRVRAGQPAFRRGVAPGQGRAAWAAGSSCLAARVIALLLAPRGRTKLSYLRVTTGVSQAHTIPTLHDATDHRQKNSRRFRIRLMSPSVCGQHGIRVQGKCPRWFFCAQADRRPGDAVIWDFPRINRSDQIRCPQANTMLRTAFTACRARLSTDLCAPRLDGAARPNQTVHTARHHDIDRRPPAANREPSLPQ
jgi:hypothetical protein